MVFEVKYKDVLGRVGRLETKSGVVETPHLFPVINPAVQVVSPKDIYEKIGCNAVITNAYLIRKRFTEEGLSKSVHELLGFKGVIATDSGAYQLLKYGEIDVDPLEIARFQEEINTDIATILDVPTGLEVNSKHAEWTVRETLARADLTLAAARKRDMLWIGPVQGGTNLELLSLSAKEMGRKPFAIYALGSPTQIMERYRFDVLVDMILTAKMNLPLDKPLHLFGAGHPFMFAMAVALGCDLFDSAAYAIYARQRRYLTESGTLKLEETSYFPCLCPVCAHWKPSEVQKLTQAEMEKVLAEHNLYVCMEEVKRVKQAIVEGRLWELVELRARSHPSMLRALGTFKAYANFLEKHSPSTKKGGIFYFGHQGLSRPEVVRYRKRIIENYTPPRSARILLLLPQTAEKPYHRSSKLKGLLGNTVGKVGVHICFYAAPYGVVPIELDDMYPLSQTEAAFPPDLETIRSTVEAVADYVMKQKYGSVVLHVEDEPLGSSLEKRCRQSCLKSGKKFSMSYSGTKPWSKEAAEKLEKTLRKASFKLKAKK